MRLSTRNSSRRVRRNWTLILHVKHFGLPVHQFAREPRKPRSVHRPAPGRPGCQESFLFRFTSSETPLLRESPDNPLPKTHLTIQNAKKSSASGFLAQHLLPPNTRQASLSACGFQAVQGTIWKLTSGPRSRLLGAWHGYRGSRASPAAKSGYWCPDFGFMQSKR